MLARNDDNDSVAKTAESHKPRVNFRGLALKKKFAKKLFANSPQLGWIVESKYFSSNNELLLSLQANLRCGIKYLYLFNLTNETYEAAFHPFIKRDSAVQALGLDGLSYETVKMICQNLPDNLVRISIKNLDQDLKDDDLQDRRLKNRSLVLLHKTLQNKTLSTKKVIEVICESDMPAIWLRKFAAYNASSIPVQTSTAIIIAQTAIPIQSTPNHSLKRYLPEAINSRPEKITRIQTNNDDGDTDINYCLVEIASFTKQLELAKQSIDNLKNQIRSINSKLPKEISEYVGADLTVQTTQNPIAADAYSQSQQDLVHYGSGNFQQNIVDLTPEQANNYLTSYTNTALTVRRYLKYEIISSKEMIAALKQKFSILQTELDEMTAHNLYYATTAHTVFTGLADEAEGIDAFDYARRATMR